MRFRLRPADFKLVNSAIQLGDWILAQPEAKPEQRLAVESLNEALRKLPELTEGLDLSFGVDLGFRNPDGTSLSRAWRVGLFTSKDERLRLVLYSTWTAYPPVAPGDELPHELDFELAMGDPEFEGEHCFTLWREEIESMSALRARSTYFEIEAEAVERA